MKRKYKCIVSVCMVMVVLCCTIFPCAAAFAAESVTLNMTGNILNVDTGTEDPMSALGSGYGYLIETGVQYQLPFSSPVEFKAGEYYSFQYKMNYTQATGNTDKIRTVVKLSLVSVDGLHVSQEIDLSNAYHIPEIGWYCGSDFVCDGVYLMCTAESDSKVMLTVNPEMYFTQPESPVGSLGTVITFITDLFGDMAGKLLKTPLFLIGIAVFVIGGLIVIIKRIL